MLGGVHQINVRDEDQRPVELRNGLDGAHVDCDAIECGDGVRLAAVVGDRDAQIDAGTDRIHVGVEYVEGVDEHLLAT